MSTLAEIKARIAELQKNAGDIISNERKAVIKDIKKKMEEYNITVDDLSAKNKPVKSVIKRNPSPVKFQKSETETWVGRGPKPKWVKDVEKKGESIEQYELPMNP